MHDTWLTRAMVAHTYGAHQGAGVTLACLQVNGDLTVVGEERDEGKGQEARGKGQGARGKRQEVRGEGQGAGGKGKGEARMRDKLVVIAPCMAVCI